MNGHSYHGFIRHITDRPFVNGVLVITALVMIGATGFKAGADKVPGIPAPDFITGLRFFISTSFVILLPVFLSLISEKIRFSRLIGVVGAVGVLIFFLTSAGQLTGPASSNVFSAKLFFALAFGLIWWGVNWCNRFHGILAIGVAVLAALIYAGFGLISRIGFSDQLFPIFIMALCFAVITLFRVSFAYTYYLEKSWPLRDRISAAVRDVMVPTILGIVIIASVVAISAISGTNEVIDSSSLGASMWMTFGVLMALFSGLGIVAIIPGFVLLIRQRSDHDATPDYTKKLRPPPGYKFYWNIMRRLFSTPSAYGFMFVLGITCILIKVSFEGVPIPQEYLLILLALLSSALGFLSLRVFVMIGVILLMSLILTKGVIAFLDLSLAASLVEQLSASGLVIIILFDAALRFRDISGGQKYPRHVIAKLMREVSGPYILLTGCVLLLLIGATMTGVWPNAAFVSIQFLLMASISFVMIMPVTKIMASRYGKF